ncbi:hypothetical protein KZ813_07820 [Sphingomonas sp. RHCKR7]|uniref:hypothetical protein n=1 Tax=Sphingomonas folli TaxID=2862497 RepID=UPI001CA4D066|nr:hypothetical protein [Sphingomonas folli]MBW6526741.1 hypothetical protein [Sphingomonas folli]
MGADLAQVVVAADAIVRAGSAAAIDVAAWGVQVSVAGTVEGGANPGIRVNAAAPYSVLCSDPYAGASVNYCTIGTYYTVYPSASATISVAAGASVMGKQALLVSRDPASTSYVTASLTNAGTLIGSTDAAVVVSLPGQTYYEGVDVINAATGAIGGIRGRVGTIRNDGAISAVNGLAIEAEGALTLTNRGTISGSVISHAVSGQNSTIDSVGGTIDGDLTLGAGNDTLVGTYTNGVTQTGVTGTIDGGAGTDTLRLGIDADATLGTIALPTNFEQLGLVVARDVTATLGDGFAGAVQLGGEGTVINRTALVGGMQVVTSTSFGYGSGSFVNAGTLRTTAAGAYAVRSSATKFDNQGTIDAAGAGVSIDSYGTSFTNSGTITAADTGVLAWSAQVTNRGTIASTGGVGLDVSGSSGFASTNSGTITGAVAGASVSSTLVNEGTISSPGTGVILSYYGTIDNRAGGRISGGARAIGPQSSNVSLFNSTVVNAGTIDGDVVLGTTSGNDFYNGNRFIALTGGVLNGNLTLGRGDTLVTELDGSSGGTFAGINGSVSATGSGLRYRVRGTASTTANGTAPAGFTSVGYDLLDGAALTLTAATAPLMLAGSGSVDVSGSITATSAPAIARGSVIYAPGEAQVTNDVLAVTSRGMLSLVRASGGAAFYPDVAVSLGERDTFTNAGTIVVGGGASAARAGTIVNGGTIRQAAGSAASDGIVGSYNGLVVTNSGTIEVAGAAIRGDYGALTIDNSGRITSTDTAAIQSPYYGATVFNRTGGTIAGNGIAVQLGSGTLSNAGAIIGDVLLGTSASGYYGAATYVAQRGTIAGDLRFGAGDDQFVSYGDDAGVSGTIDAGDGVDTFVYARDASATVTLGQSLPTSFEREGARAVGTDVVLTLRSDAPITQPLRLSGDGTIINTATIDASVSADSLSLAPGSTPAALAFVNRGSIRGLGGTVRDFDNQGTITAASDSQFAVALITDTTLSARNAGLIAGGINLSSENYFFPSDTPPGALSIGYVNTGTTSVARGAAVQLSSSSYQPRDVALSLDNSGTIEASGAASYGAALTTGTGGAIQSITVTNSGTIRANGGGERYTYGYPPFVSSFVSSSIALALYAADDASATVINAKSGVIEATGASSTALSVNAGMLTLVNAGTIHGGAGETIENYDYYSAAPYTYYLPGAIAGSGGVDTITNSGAIIGSMALYDGDDRLDSTGRIVGDVFLGAGDDRVTLAGSFAGAIDGGDGTDSITVTGGTAAAPIAFTRLTDVEQLAVTGGYATIAGAAALRRLDVTGGRLVGLAGSTISAPLITVARGATFGSAGTVDANLAIAGTLSPGASPGTMTVNGNVALAGGSTALFEITPSVYDKLVVNGAVSIASGATLQLVSATPLRAGTSYQLITATGGVNGAFTTVQLPGSQPGVVLQDAGSLRVLAQFAQPTSLAPQVANSVAYVNAALAAAPRDAALLAGVPALLDASGATDARAFARLTPEAYASATQLGVDQALSLAQVARGGAFATDHAEAGAFTFAQTVGQWHRLAADSASGSSAASAQSYGFLGGVGYGDRGWMVGVFAGYLNGRQQIGALGTRTRADGAVAGLHARYTAPAGWGFSGSLLYDGGEARTDRALPGTVAASARYGLHSWVSDVSLHHTQAVGGDWTLRPRLGATLVRTARDGVSEEGASPFALQVARERHVAGFVDAGLTLARAGASDARFRPHVALGLRHQVEGRRVDARAGFTGGPLGLDAVGAARASVVGTAAAGIDYRLSAAVNLFSAASAQTGRDDHQESITTGVRLRF